MKQELYTPENKLQIDFHHDAGHGWLKVKRDLIPFHILQKITGYSYQAELMDIGKNGKPEKTRFVFLEEDLDAAKFVNDFGEDRITVNCNYDGSQSPIRRYGYFHL